MTFLGMQPMERENPLFLSIKLSQIQSKVGDTSSLSLEFYLKETRHVPDENDSRKRQTG